MAVDRALYRAPRGLPAPEEEAVTIDVEPVSEYGEDGSVVIDFSGAGQFDPENVPHGANLAEHLTEEELAGIGSELLVQYQADKRSRKDWETAYKKGLDFLGLKIEERTEPWEGACGVFHPLLTESIVRFQSHAIMETFPADGPVKTKICGVINTDLERRAKRIRDDMNYIITEKMPEYRNEHERLLFNLPLCGSAFKKIWYDPAQQRPRADFVAADDFVVSYGATELQSCPRYTHAMRLPENDVRKLQAAGLYMDVDLHEPVPDMSEIKEAENKLTGHEAVVEDDDRHLILEMHVDYDMPGVLASPDGIAKPYVITFTGSGQVLAIYRNWVEGDPTFQKRMWFSHYYYLPGLGFYGIGLIHLIGGLTKSATSILRQLVDAGTLANLPGGFKAKGFRVKGEDTPIGPGEWRDVDIPSDDLRKALMPLPYKEPSTVLYQLLERMTEEGRRIGSIADIDITDSNKETPVGTTLAIMERSLKVISAVQARLFASMRSEFKILKGIIRDNMPGEYYFSVEDNATRSEDYSEQIDVIPVANPNASTMAQKVVQYQAAIQMSASAPNVYNMAELHRGMVEALELKNPDKVVPIAEDMTPMDPVAENMAIIRQEPVRAFLHQDHDAHLAAHMAAIEDPNIQEMVGQSPNANAIQASAMAHIAEHVAFKHRRDVEMQLGTPMPSPDEKLPRDVEVQLSKLLSQAAIKAMQQSKHDYQQRQAEEQLQDPVIQMQLREIEIKERKQEFDEFIERRRLEYDMLKAGAEIGAELTTTAAKLDLDARKEGFKLATSFTQKLMDVETKEKQEETKREQIRATREASRASSQGD